MSNLRAEDVVHALQSAQYDLLKATIGLLPVRKRAALVAPQGIVSVPRQLSRRKVNSCHIPRRSVQHCIKRRRMAHITVFLLF